MLVQLRKRLHSFKGLTAEEVRKASWAEVVADLHHFIVLLVKGCLVVVGVFGVLRGIGYSPFFGPEDLPTGVRTISIIIPIYVFAAAWFLSGVYSFLAALRTNPRGTIGVIILSAFWAVGYTTSWVMSWGSKVAPQVVGNPPDGSRDYLNASVYWTIFLLLVAGIWLATHALRFTSRKNGSGSGAA